MRIEDLDEMRRFPLFSGVAPDHVDAMLKASFLQRFPSGVELVREGEPADFLHVVVDGQVELFSAYRERETTVGVIGAGKSFIVAAVLLDKIYLKSARALSPSRILMIPADAVRCYFQDDSAFARSLTFELALAYRSVIKELKNQKLRSGLERLANWLLSWNKEVAAKGRFELPFDKKVLASRLGMAPEVLSRSFAALIPYKVLVNGPHVQLNDLAALTQLAHPSATIDDPAA
jgi:CRP/FNR family transcriptional regulator, transcriptional activator FtrB